MFGVRKSTTNLLAPENEDYLNIYNLIKQDIKIPEGMKYRGKYYKSKKIVAPKTPEKPP